MFRLFATLERLTPLAAFSLLLIAAGCNQDPIFDYISGETAPTEARIKGSPSKILGVTINEKEKLYLANGRIWEYAPSEPDSSWQRIAGPGGYVADVASTEEALYALSINNTATKVWKDKETGWTELAPPGDYGFIQNIFGAGNVLFATGAKRAGDGYDYAILYYKQSDLALTITEVTGDVLLTGAGKIGDDYYLAVWGKGIYKTSNAGLPTLTLENNPSIPSTIVGLLQADKDHIIGISKGGLLVLIDTSGVTVDPTSLGGTYTGALALMDSPDPQNGYDKLLLLGYKDESALYTHGYMELGFNLDGTREENRRIPGENQPSSVSDYRQYDSSLRRYPVTALWVLKPAQAGEPSVIFAATTNQGLYSYRDRSDGGWQWNHEE
jgi:hypothetical protein